MAAFPPSPQIVGKHGGIFEAYYMQADPLGTGSIGALDAANFLKKSKLGDKILSQVWDMSDPMGKGYLEKTGFYIALKLISLAQNKQEMSMANLIVEVPPPDLGPVEVVDQSAQTANIPWDITLSEKSKYDKVFDSLQPVNNMLAGDKVKPVLMNSKLPVDILGRIWDMSDIDKDGYLDRDEFAVAMHLVYQAREGLETPSVLRPGLVPPSKRKGSGPVAAHMPGAVSVLPMSGPTPVSSIASWGRSTPVQGFTGPQIPWVVTAAEKSSSDMIFKQLDTDHDGLVSGAEIRDILAQSGLRTTVLAHIWGLCDSQSVGKLTPDQFALAMHLIQQKLKGIEPPAQLTPDMIPPSLRSVSDPGAFGVRNGTNSGPYSHVADFSAIKALDHISKEIEDIKKEKLLMERDKAQHEADIKIRQSEVQVLQKELDSLTGTLAQLESQKKEAQRRLDELDDKRSSLEKNVQDLRGQADIGSIEVRKMKSLLSNREQHIKDQEAELEKLKRELAQLKEEEAKLEHITDSSKQQLEQLAVSQGTISSEILMTKTHLQQLQNQYKGLDPELSNSSDFSSEIAALSEAANNTAHVGINNFSTFTNVDEFKDDPFKDQDVFGGIGMLSDSQNDPFQNEDPFKENDPFKSGDPFGSDDPFKGAFADISNTIKSEDAFDLSTDHFSGLSQTGKDAGGFDAFGLNWDSKNSAVNQTSNKTSSFSTDPFSAPSKPNFASAQKKAPPPRPAPPKSKSPTPFGSMSTSPKLSLQPLSGFDSDPFGGNDPFNSSGTKSITGNSSADPFANFADFSPGKFTSPDDDDVWNSGGPSTITIKNVNMRQPQVERQNINLNNVSRGFDDSEA